MRAETYSCFRGRKTPHVALLMLNPETTIVDDTAARFSVPNHPSSAGIKRTGAGDIRHDCKSGCLVKRRGSPWASGLRGSNTPGCPALIFLLLGLAVLIGFCDFTLRMKIPGANHLSIRHRNSHYYTRFSQWQP